METPFKGLVENLEAVTLVDKIVQEKLRTSMSPDFGLLVSLRAHGTISDSESEEIKKQRTVEDRNSKLLEIILKRGLVKKLAQALLETKQSHLVAFIASSGVHRPEFEYNWPLSDSQLYILDINRYILAERLVTFELLLKLVERDVISEEEKNFIEKIEGDRKKNLELIDILKRGSEKNYFEMVNSLRIVGQGYMSSILKKGISEIIGAPVETDLIDLPAQTYQLIIVKAYIRTLITSPERHPEKDIFKGLCNVSQMWHKMVTSPGWRDAYEYHISGYFNRMLRRATVVSNNRYYLSWRITPKKFIDFMRHAGCISDDDTRFIKCQEYDHDKIDETLSVVRDLSIEKYATYIDCLRRTGQHLYADISELGGVTVKVKSIHDDMPNLREVEKKVIERINQVRDKKIPYSEELQKEIDVLRHHDIEILDAIHDKGIIIWFWVHSEQGHEQIHKWRDEDYMEPYLEKLFSIFGRWREPIGSDLKKYWVIIDGFQFNREVINLPMTLYWYTELDINTSKGPVRGVTLLHDKFYVLHPKSILVYEAQPPCNYVKEITLPEFGSLSDIAACGKSIHLYAVDNGNSCVWKIGLENNQVEKWLSNIGAPFTCSVSSRSGEVVLVRQGKPAFVEIYGQDAALVCKLPLPDRFQNPCHAVENRSGNYNVLDKQGLIEMTREGVVTRQHKSFRHGEENPLQDSCHLAVDIGERLYVAERDRIVQFDSQLVFEQVMLDQPKIKSPTRLYHVESKKLLMVVHSQGKKVFAYNLRPRD